MPENLSTASRIPDHILCNNRIAESAQERKCAHFYSAMNHICWHFCYILLIKITNASVVIDFIIMMNSDSDSQDEHERIAEFCDNVYAPGLALGIQRVCRGC
jgi:hypothetical protein